MSALSAIHWGSWFLGVASALGAVFVLTMCMIAKDDGTLFGEGPSTKGDDEFLTQLNRKQDQGAHSAAPPVRTGEALDDRQSSGGALPANRPAGEIYGEPWQ